MQRSAVLIVSNHFYDSGRFIAVGAKLNIGAVFDEAGREYACSAFAAEEYYAFVKYRKAVYDAGTSYSTAYLAFNLIEEADINGIEAAVKLYPLNVDPNTEQLGRAGLYGYDASRIEQFLSFAAEIHANISQAFFAAAGVIHLACVYAYCFTETACACYVSISIAAHGSGAADFIRHNDYLQMIMGNNYITNLFR